MRQNRAGKQIKMLDINLFSKTMVKTLTFFFLQRANMLNHNSLNGRGKLLPKNLRMHMISWIDAPDDVYFIATSATK